MEGRKVGGTPFNVIWWQYAIFSTPPHPCRDYLEKFTSCYLLRLDEVPC